MEKQPRPYRKSLEYLSESKFHDLETDIYERYHLEIYPDKDDHLWDGIWDIGGHHSRGIGNIKSRIKYMIKRDSTFAKRKEFELDYLKYNDLIKKLLKIGFTRIKGGKGSHEKWKSPKGNRKITVPRHHGDIPKGTLNRIIKSIDWEAIGFKKMNLREFIAFQF